MWRSNCQLCNRLISVGGGIFCGNFSYKRESWTPCRRAWCGPCYKLELSDFPVERPKDEDGEEIILSAEEECRFLQARDGDSLCAPFQCKHCHFVNLCNRTPLENYAPDIRLLKSIRRSNLDAFWALEPITVKRVVDEAKWGIVMATEMGFTNNLFRPMGPFPVEDIFGMGAAVVMQQRSLERGKYTDRLQYETVRKFRVAVSNIYHASVEGHGATVMVKDTKKLIVMECPTYSGWFEKCMKGMHKRLGDEAHPDRALSLEILLEIMKLVEHDWNVCSPRKKLKLALEGAFYLIPFTLALRGEEVPLVDLKGLRSHWEQGANYKTPHVVITLLGRFKNEVGEAYHIMPVCAETPRGLFPRRWIGRVIDGYFSIGVTSGYVFRKPSGERTKMSDFEPAFFERLEHVKQLRPDLISPSLEVSEHYGVSRSFRRGATSEATNGGATNEVIEANGRWRKSHQSGSRRPNLTIREHYTDIRMILDLLLKFSSYL